MSIPFRYEDAERYLASLELFGMRFGLERMSRLMTVLGTPLASTRAVQVVGTNGKSSTTRMIAAVLRAHGLRAGAYLSPHLISFAERVEVDGQALERERFAAAVARARRAAELVERGLEDGERVTQFEVLTAAAYLALERSKIEAAVVEAGLGGRYDATSVIRPEVVVVTNISLEHARWLGPTERHVAEEKLAVVPEGGTLVAGPLSPDARAVADRVTAERGARLLALGRDFELEEHERDFGVRTPARSFDRLCLRALGRFQQVNFAVALAAAEQLLGGLETGAVEQAVSELELPGRLEVVGREPLVIFDGAHNPAAATALAASLEPVLGGKAVTGVMSMLDDKDAAGMLTQLLPRFERVVFTRSSHGRALPPATLESLCRQLSGPPAEVVGDPGAALERARALAGRDGAVLVTGSIYLLSDLVRTAADRRSQAV